MQPPIDYLKSLSGSDRFAECVRVLLALSGIVLYGLLAGDLESTLPMLLGAIACALAETEDQWRNRLSTLLVTLACFALAAFAVEWLLPRPVPFALALWLGAFALVMLGALNGRYATIAGATLILSVYTMIGADLAHGPPADLAREPVDLLIGAAWYGVLSLLWSALAPQQAVRLALAGLYRALADQLEGKAALFVPVHGTDYQALQLDLAMRNETVVQALNQTRLILVDRIGNRRARGATAALLQQYFVAQDIHERINSSHYPYDALAETLFHSDVLFRCAHLLRLQAGHCRALADALRVRDMAAYPGTDRAALADLHAAVATLGQSSPPPGADLRQALHALLRNLSAIQARLDGERADTPEHRRRDNALQDPAPRSPAEAWSRLRAQLSPRAPRFRHAIRLATALLVGDLVLQWVHPQHGYWILLTTLFVCQPSFHATWRVLLQRVGGTVLGLLAGWAVLHSLPVPWQLPLVVLSGVLFFAARYRRYALATAAITLFVVLLVNQVGNGYAVMWPRLIDTLIGAVIAALAIQLILPDWQRRRLGHVLADTVRSEADYLARILAQYRSGKRDDLPYRIARRDAHNADATLSVVVANMLREPAHQRHGSELLLRFLTVAHRLLGHLSTLGAHRHLISSEVARTALTEAGHRTVTSLELLADWLVGIDASQPVQQLPPARPNLPTTTDLADDGARLALAQLALVLDQRDQLAALAPAIAQR